MRFNKVDKDKSSFNFCRFVTKKEYHNQGTFSSEGTLLHIDIILIVHTLLLKPIENLSTILNVINHMSMASINKYTQVVIRRL